MAASREERIEPRTTKAEKRLLAVARAERITLSERDSVRVLELLENPPKPSPDLVAAAGRHVRRNQAIKRTDRPPS
jgi:uncharacterized protein (DUF1778 family)